MRLTRSGRLSVRHPSEQRFPAYEPWTVTPLGVWGLSTAQAIAGPSLAGRTVKFIIHDDPVHKPEQCSSAWDRVRAEKKCWPGPYPDCLA